MRPVSAQFLAALTGSHGMVVRANIASHAGPAVLGASVQVVSGQVTLDGTAAIRGSLDMVVAGRWPTPADLAADGRVDGTAPVPTVYGPQVQVSRGVRFGNGVVEVAKLGTFVVEGMEQDGLRATPEIHITGRDRAGLVSDAGVDTALAFPAATTWTDMVAAVLTGAHSLLTCTLDFDGSTPIGQDMVLDAGTADMDRLKFLTDAAAALSKGLWVGADGIFQIADLPDPGVPVWTVAAGPGGVMVSTGRHLSRAGQANGVLATGDSASDVPPARGLAYDSGPASVTAWGDAFGRRLKVFASPLLLTDSAAEAAAATVLSRSVGLPYALDLSAVPNPALEPWDVIQVEHSPDDVELHMLDRVVIPLAADQPVTLATRETSTVVVSVA